MKKIFWFSALFAALPAAFCGENASAVPAGQIAYYSFDADTKDCLHDAVSALNIIPRKTMPSSDFKPGVSGSALELLENSKGQYVCKDPRLTKLAPPFTISVWIKRYEGNTKNSIIVASATDQAPKGFELVWSWRYLVFRMGKGSGKPFVIRSPNPTLTVNSWINVAVSCDEKSASIYINGEKVASGTLAAGEKFYPADGIGSLFTIGHYPTPFDAYKHVGLIDELRIFNRALSDEEVAEVMFLSQN